MLTTILFYDIISMTDDLDMLITARLEDIMKKFSFNEFLEKVIGANWEYVDNNYSHIDELYSEYYDILDNLDNPYYIEFYGKFFK